MHTRLLTARHFTIGIPMLFFALLTTQCADSAGDPNSRQDDTTPTGVVGDGSTTNGSNANGSTTNGSGTNSADAGSTGNNSSNAQGQGMVALYPGDRVVPTTPVEERNMVITDMHGLRSILVADLEVVRARLNVGTQPEPQSKNDQALAADLAQGLERVDRALLALDASTDATWASMRTSQLKEVKEVREWMVGYRGRPESRF